MGHTAAGAGALLLYHLLPRILGLRRPDSAGAATARGCVVVVGSVKLARCPLVAPLAMTHGTSMRSSQLSDHLWLPRSLAALSPHRSPSIAHLPGAVAHRSPPPQVAAIFLTGDHIMGRLGDISDDTG
jgi:hypothetical protein